MFAFLTRLGRLFVATIVLAGVISIIALMSTSGILVASHHQGASTMSCTVAMGPVVNGQRRLQVNASGLLPSSSYVYGQTGSQTANVTTSSAGSFSDQSLFYHGPGTYSIVVNYYYFNNTHLVHSTVASCSAQL
jgi:hypothetical protein